MRAAYYESVGPAFDVIRVGERPAPEPQSGEVRIRIRASGVNPSDVKARAGARGALAYPYVIPHSDGAGVIDSLGGGVDPKRIGERVWTWNAAWRRAFGTCAEFVCLPSEQAVTLPESIDFDSGACLGTRPNAIAAAGMAILCGRRADPHVRAGSARLAHPNGNRGRTHTGL